MTNIPVSSFQDVEREFKKIHLGVERLLAEDRLLRARIDHTTGISTGLSPVFTPGTNHGSLSNLGADDHSQYMHTSLARTVTAQHSFAPVSSQAPFTLGANAQGELVTGFNADQLDSLEATVFLSPQYLTLATDTNLTNERVLTAGDGIDFVDAGAGSALTVSIDLATNSGLEFDTGELQVDEDYAFTWTALHTFNAGLTIAVGENLNFGSDAYLTRVAASSIAPGPDDSLVSSTFTSGLTGWQISAIGDAEFNNIVARGELRSSVFVTDEVHATGGTLLVATAGTLINEVNATVGSIRTTADGDTRTTADGDTRTLPAGISTLDIKDPPSGHASIFSVGDILRWKVFNGSSVIDNWATVLDTDDNSTHYSYDIRIESGTLGRIPEGTTIVNYGQAGDGQILLTADLANAPYIDIFTSTVDPWNGVTPHVRIGRLDGLAVVGIEQYGMVAGTDLSDGTSAAKYIVASDQQVLLNNVDIELWLSGDQTVDISSSGNVKFGSDVSASATTSFDFNATTGLLTLRDVDLSLYDGSDQTVDLSSDGDLKLGTDISAPATTSFDFDSATGDLELTGDITATGGEFSGVLSIGSSGGIWQGSSGTFASPTTGFKLYQSSGKGLWEAWDSGAKQVYIDTDMSLKSGGGLVVLDADGISVAVTNTYGDTRSYNFHSGSTVTGGLYGYRNLGEDSIKVICDNSTFAATGITSSSSSDYSLVTAIAASGGSSFVIMQSSGEIRVDACPLALTDGITAPSTLAGFGQLYIDSADGDLKIKFGDGTVKTIATDS